VSTTRLEAFSDGVFAIAATLAAFALFYVVESSVFGRDRAA